MSSCAGPDLEPQGEVWPLLQAWVEHVPRRSAADLGAGEGANAAWLERHGFDVVALENDPARAATLRAAGLQVRQIDMADYRPEPDSLGLVLAAASLHFLRPSRLWELADRLAAALAPGGLLIGEVLTTDDPTFADHLAGAEMIEPNTFQSLTGDGVIHYFEPGELRRVFAMLEPAHYQEDRRLSELASAGYRAGATLVARRPIGAEQG